MEQLGVRELWKQKDHMTVGSNEWKVIGWLKQWGQRSNLTGWEEKDGKEKKWKAQ